MKSNIKIIFPDFLLNERNNIRNTNVYLTASPITDTLEINTVTFTFNSDRVMSYFSDGKAFNIWFNNLNIGRFYITGIDQVADGVYTVSGEDLKGALDKEQYMGGIFEQVTFSSLVADILGEREHYIETPLRNVMLSGYLPICSKREALRQACFAVGACVDTSFRDDIKFFVPKEQPRGYVTPYRTLEGLKVSQTQPISTINLTEHKYIKPSDSRLEELYNGYLISGTYTVTFKKAMYGLSCVGATIIDSGANYATIKLSIPSDVIITGYAYDNVKKINTRSIPNIITINPNTVDISNATLISADNSNIVLDNLSDFYNKASTISERFIMTSERPLDAVNVFTPLYGMKTGRIISLDINFSSTMVATANILIEKDYTDSVFCDEVFTGEWY